MTKKELLKIAKDLWWKLDLYPKYNSKASKEELIEYIKGAKGLVDSNDKLEEITINFLKTLS
jgi:hypothetical protein